MNCSRLKINLVKPTLVIHKRKYGTQEVNLNQSVNTTVPRSQAISCNYKVRSQKSVIRKRSIKNKHWHSLLKKVKVKMVCIIKLMLHEIIKRGLLKHIPRLKNVFVFETKE